MWIALGALFFIPFLGGVHLFDWDEINFAEIAREMIESGDYLRMQIGYFTFTEKPPLFFWLQAIFMHLFGIGEFSARFPNALLGVIVLPLLYLGGKRLVDKKFGMLWAMSWFGSILPFLYFKSGIIDPWFNFFTFAGFTSVILYTWKKGGHGPMPLRKSPAFYLGIGGLMLGLAVLTKGPVAFLVVAICIAAMWFVKRSKLHFSFISFLKLGLVALGVFMLWFIAEFLARGPAFIVEFTIRQWELLTRSDAGHGGFPGYHLVVLLIGCFPASIFAIRGMGKFPRLPASVRDVQKWMIILLFTILALFSLVGTKIVHYSSLAYYPVTFLSALAMWHILNNKAKHAVWITLSLVFTGLVLIVVSAAIPWLGMHPEILLPVLEKDPFAAANLDAGVEWTFWHYIPALLMVFALAGFLAFLPRKKKTAYRIFFFGTGTWVMFGLIFFIQNIEGISQAAAVEFFESQQGKDAYVTTYGYKSYVPVFYGRIMPDQKPPEKAREWLYGSDIDKPVYISTKITKRERLESDIPDAQFLYEKNGFVFYKRIP